MLFSSIITIIKDLRVFYNVISDYKCVKVFKLLVYLNTRAYIVVLFKALYARNLLLLRVPFYLIVVTVYEVSIEFLFKLSRNFKGERVGVNN
jgi:hypothetical protein